MAELPSKILDATRNRYDLERYQYAGNGTDWNIAIQSERKAFLAKKTVII